MPRQINALISFFSPCSHITMRLPIALYTTPFPPDTIPLTSLGTIIIKITTSGLFSTHVYRMILCSS